MYDGNVNAAHHSLRQSLRQACTARRGTVEESGGNMCALLPRPQSIARLIVSSDRFWSFWPYVASIVRFLVDFPMSCQNENQVAVINLLLPKGTTRMPQLVVLLLVAAPWVPTMAGDLCQN